MSGESADRSRVKWPSFKKYRRTGTHYRPVTNHPGTDAARSALQAEGRRLDLCEDCGTEIEPFAIHHRDGNPYNNDPENLLVLCMDCHLFRHGPADAEGVASWREGTIDERQADRELGIVEDKDKGMQLIKLRITKAAYQCMECNTIIYVAQSRTKLRQPGRCPRCHGTTFHLIDKQSTFEAVG